jgi:hypothetical protein
VAVSGLRGGEWGGGGKQPLRAGDSLALAKWPTCYPRKPRSCTGRSPCPPHVLSGLSRARANRSQTVYEL